MPGIISAALLRFLPWIAGALLALGLFAYIFHEHAALRRAEHNVAAARDTVSQLEATNRENLDALKRLQKTAAAWQIARTEAAAEDARRAADARQMLDAIAASGTVSPRVLPRRSEGQRPGHAGNAGGSSAGAPTAATPGIPVILARTLESIAAAQAVGQGTTQAASNRVNPPVALAKKPSGGARQ